MVMSFAEVQWMGARPIRAMIARAGKVEAGFPSACAKDLSLSQALAGGFQRRCGDQEVRLFHATARRVKRVSHA
jgi:hypothetical protein